MGKTESHLPAESKDPVILNSPPLDAAPLHTFLGVGWRRWRGLVLQYSCYTATAFLESDVALGVLYQGLCVSRGHQSLPGHGGIACQGQWAEGRREQTCNGLSCPLAALKAASRTCRNRDPFSTAAAIHRKHALPPWNHKKPVLT